ncbi:MAG: hypothetical protein ACI4JC_03885 [Faecalibacterium sp.]
MEVSVPVVNTTPELADCRGAWTFDQEHDCWCLEDILYTQKATTPKFQRMSIFMPAAYLDETGTVRPEGACGSFTARTAPVVFENNAAGYMQMPHTWLGGPRDEAGKYLARGMVYVTCGCRGRDSRDQNEVLCGKSPWSLVDLKTAIRFLRHNAAVLPGDFSRIISVGWSAGGAMSSLLALTGDHPRYAPFLEQNGAYPEESDAVFAAQIYCPIVDLDHADLAYEWQFQKDPENEASHAGPAGRMTPFQAALSQELADAYIRYFNGLGLTDPAAGTPLTLNKDGRSGTGYDYLMSLLEDSASDYLARLDAGQLGEAYSSAEYLCGHYTRKVPAPKPSGQQDAMQGHAGPGVALAEPSGLPGMPQNRRPNLGDRVSRPPRGVPYQGTEPQMIEVPGTDKRDWLSWDGRRAHITDLDSYLLAHRRRMKPCTSFDTLNMDSGENQEFGSAEQDYLHFDPDIAQAMNPLREQFPEEYALYHDAYAAAARDPALTERKYLINPMNFIGDPDSTSAKHYRIRVGACDADTAFTISMALAVRLANEGFPVDYALVWDRPHCEADYEGEVCDWIEGLCR